MIFQPSRVRGVLMQVLRRHLEMLAADQPAKALPKLRVGVKKPRK
jgi:hypothetical protein